MHKLFTHTISVRQLLRLSSVLCFVFGGAFLLMPVVPNVQLASTVAPIVPQVLGVTTSEKFQPAALPEQTNPQENRLIIPEIGVDAVINEGASEDTLLSGIWRIPTSSTPDKGSNTVLTAHRFQWLTGANTFYHLDKLNTGHVISVLWNGQKYLYKVSSTFETTSDDLSIEQPTNQPILTLYTCKLWWDSDTRLVVIAERV